MRAVPVVSVSLFSFQKQFPGTRVRLAKVDSLNMWNNCQHLKIGFHITLKNSTAKLKLWAPLEPHSWVATWHADLRGAAAWLWPLKNQERAQKRGPPRPALLTLVSHHIERCWQTLARLLLPQPQSTNIAGLEQHIQ